MQVKLNNFFSLDLRRKVWGLAGDIRFWIGLFFLIRLIGITQPPLEVAHNWRQTTVAMVARNFYETDPDILLPRVDMAGEKSGITGMEFPLLNYLIFLMAKLFGYQHWYGRLINLLVSSIGIWAFYCLVKRFLNARIAFRASIVLLSSLWFIYSRKIMPDTFSVSLVLAGFALACSWLYDNRHNAWLFAAALLIAAGLLSKAPAGVCLALLPFVLFEAKAPINRRIALFAAVTLSLIPMLWWYFVQVPALNEKGGFVHFFMGKPLKTGLVELLQRPAATTNMFYETAIKFSGFALFVLGIFALIADKRKVVLGWFFLSSVLFLVFMFRAGETFSRHSYYMIPFIPCMAVVAALGLEKIRMKRLSGVLLAIVVLEGLLNQQHDFRIRPESRALMNIEGVMDGLGTRNELVAINSGETPTPLYFAHRKGWLLSNNQMADSRVTDSLKKLGLQKLIVLKKAFGSEITLNKPLLFENEHFRIYEP